MANRLISPARILLAIATMAGFMVIGHHFAVNALIGNQQNQQLENLLQVVLRRTETAVDLGTLALDGLLSRGISDCAPTTLQVLRFQVYQNGALKDIRVADRNGAIRCAAFEETLEFDQTWPNRTDMVPSEDGESLLFPVDQFSGMALGVLKDVDADRALIAILEINTSLLDVLPAGLREHGHVAIRLENNTQLARFDLAGGPGRIGPTREFSAASDRYPLRGTISVDRYALAQWNNDIYLPALSLAGVLGLAFGVLLGRAIARAGSPVAQLDRAIAAGAIKPYLQPIFDLGSGRIVGCEMLARWVHPNGEITPPSRFIPLAEQSGRIEKMTWQLLAEALADLKPLLTRDRAFTLSFNVTPSHFLSEGFVDRLREVAVEAGVSYRQIAVEITEREPFDDLERASKTVAGLRECGFKVAIDDVGIGHSGLSHLQSLGASTLKIDKFFIDSINADSTARSIIEMLVRLGTQLDMKLVAEGIELPDQIETLIECGVAEGQGYVVSPPLPADDFMGLIDRSETGEHGTRPALTRVA